MRFSAMCSLMFRAGTLGRAASVALVLLGVSSGAHAEPNPAGGAMPGAAAGNPPMAAPAAQGLAALVKVNLPLSSGADAPLQAKLTRARDQLLSAARQRGDARRPMLVLQIAPASGVPDGGKGSQFETVLSLARFLNSREMADVKTVAWLPQSIKGHGVLAAIACEEIVMPAEAELGEAGIDEADRGAVSRLVVEAYREIADAKRTVPVALALGMIDPAVEVLEVESDEGIRFLLRDEVEEFRREHEIIRQEVLIPAGTLGRFTGREGRQFGFVKYLAEDRAAVAKALSVPVESLEESQALLADWKPIMLVVRGEITPGAVGQLTTLLHNHLSSGANWVGVRIDSVGGDLAACLELAARLAELDPNSVRTVAYVPVEARGGGGIVALACDQLVMHPQAKLGLGPEGQALVADHGRELPRGRRRRPPPFFDNRPDPRDAQVDIAAAVATIRDSLAPRTEHSWSLMAAMIDPGIEVYRYRNKATGEERLMGGEEAAALADAGNWTRGAPLQEGNQSLEISGTRAVQAGVAWQTVDNFDQLEQLYNLDDVRNVEPNWALKLIHALASPGLAAFLLLLGLVGMYIELKTPGVGVGGVVAALSFMLFFWSKYLEGTAGSLEIIMFTGGVVLMLIEIFVIPGVGIFGLAGGLMVIFSLILASQTFVVPHSEADLEELRRSITVVAAAGAGMIGLAFATRRYLPKAPLFNRMVLEPPPPEERVTLAHREAVADYSHLVGTIGEAVTDLRPGGRALVSGQLIDVIAEGLPIDRGASVLVVEAHGNRVRVREAT
ncbi:MAG: hypothetical protein IT424_11965 [Pirellulales bacterium]|nr:hypothetical protein [Pirellulales bacterium]